MLTRRLLGRLAAPVIASILAGTGLSRAQQRQPGPNEFSLRELVDAGGGFFGGVSAAIGTALESTVSRWGYPNGYILGEEGGGAVVAGLRYGEGRLRTKRGDDLKIFWQGPSVGWDFGGDGSKVMILVYNLGPPTDLLRRFAGVSGSAYAIGGVAITALAYENLVVVPVRSGVGLRLGANLGYIKFTDHPDWNPF